MVLFVIVGTGWGDSYSASQDDQIKVAGCEQLFRDVAAEIADACKGDDWPGGRHRKSNIDEKPKVTDKQLTAGWWRAKYLVCDTHGYHIEIVFQARVRCLERIDIEINESGY